MEQPDLWAIETERFAQGIQTICGVDEAGAGPLAGRVYAGAVILPKGWTHPWLGDSKKVTEKRREVLYDLIRDEAVAWSIAWAEAEEIDALNILNARMLAMQRAMDGLSVSPDLALIDGNRSNGITTPNETVVKGDGKTGSSPCRLAYLQIPSPRSLRSHDLPLQNRLRHLRHKSSLRLSQSSP